MNYLKYIAFLIVFLIPISVDARITSTTPGITMGDSTTSVESSTGNTINSNVGLHVATGGNSSWTLPPTVTGKRHCFVQAVGQTNTITITPKTLSYISKQDLTANCTVSHAIKSSGSSGDAICYTAIDATHWSAVSGAVGTWTCQ